MEPNKPLKLLTPPTSGLRPKKSMNLSILLLCSLYPPIYKSFLSWGIFDYFFVAAKFEAP